MLKRYFRLHFKTAWSNFVTQKCIHKKKIIEMNYRIMFKIERANRAASSVDFWAVIKSPRSLFVSHGFTVVKSNVRHFGVFLQTYFLTIITPPPPPLFLVLKIFMSITSGGHSSSWALSSPNTISIF